MVIVLFILNELISSTKILHNKQLHSQVLHLSTQTATLRFKYQCQINNFNAYV